MMEEKIAINGESCVLGRIASFSAKQALQGKKIIILNSEKILISGNKQSIVRDYLILRRRRNVKFPSNPEQIMKRAIRGMINYKEGRGADAFKKIRCYNGVPEEFKSEKMIQIGRGNKNLMSLGELSKRLK